MTPDPLTLPHRSPKLYGLAWRGSIQEHAGQIVNVIDAVPLPLKPAQAAERFERAGKAEGKSMPKGIEEQKLDSIIAIAQAAINEYLADQAYTADLLNHRPTHASRQAVNDRKSVLRCAIKDYISQTKG